VYGHDRIVVGFTTTYAISAYHHWCCEWNLDHCEVYNITNVCDKVCQWLATGRWFPRVLRFPPPIKLTVTI